MRELVLRVLAVILAPSGATRWERRVLGTVLLMVVVLMVVLGCLMLGESVGPLMLLLFWGACFLLVLWSVFLAYVDVKSIREDFRAQRKEIFLAAFSRSDFEKRLKEKRGASSTAGKPGGGRETGPK